MLATSFRTHTCNELTIKDVDCKVKLSGWVNKIRDMGQIAFVDLRDSHGITQLVFEKDNAKLVKELSLESVIKVTGTVRERESKNPNLKTGDIEVVVDSLEILSTPSFLPVLPNDKTKEETDLKNRFITLRNLKRQEIFSFQTKLLNVIRNFLHSRGFKEVFTPILTKSTPEGARDFLVPSRIHRGKFYALPQSPQLFKQLLMVAGFDRYFQFAKCFRDEDLRANRQPEFVQLDMEMSFVNRGDVMALVEELIKEVFWELIGFDINTFKVLTYKECIEDYGCDKPNLQTQKLEIYDVSSLFENSDFKIFAKLVDEGKKVKTLFLPKVLSRKEMEAEEKEAKKMDLIIAPVSFKNGKLSGRIAKFIDVEKLTNIVNPEGDGTFIFAAGDDHTFELLGLYRNSLIKRYNLEEKKFACVWIIDFPMWEKDEEGNLHAKHHPFTMPSDPNNLENSSALAYDLVINGEEIGGGSIRIHDYKIQEKVFEFLGISKKEAEEKFGFLLNALKSGVPPHGGIAFGFERLVMTLLDIDDIKEVIAFPKTTSASCLLTDAPSFVQEEQLKELSIKVIE